MCEVQGGEVANTRKCVKKNVVDDLIQKFLIITNFAQDALNLNLKLIMENAIIVH